MGYVRVCQTEASRDCGSQGLPPTLLTSHFISTPVPFQQSAGEVGMPLGKHRLRPGQGMLLSAKKTASPMQRQLLCVLLLDAAWALALRELCVKWLNNELRARVKTICRRQKKRREGRRSTTFRRLPLTHLRCIAYFTLRISSPHHCSCNIAAIGVLPDCS